MTRKQQLLVAAVGLVAGLAAGLLGIGGGLVMVPGLTLVLGMPLKRAVGTSLLGVMVIATVGVLTELAVAPGNLHWLAAALLAAGAILGSWLGARLVAVTSAALLARLLALLLLVAALKMSGLVGGLGGADSTLAAASATGDGWSVARSAAHAVVGVGAGVISAMFGVGGGILAVPLLDWLHPAWAFQDCRATSLIMIIPTAIAGAAFHRRLENLAGGVAIWLIAGSLGGAVAGVVLANRLPARPLELLFAMLLLVTGVRLARGRAPSPTAERGQQGRG